MTDEVIARFTEVESGKRANRPELTKALHIAKVTGATLLYGLMISATLVASDRQRRQLAARLASEREAREQVTTILESITDAFLAVDREWRFTHVNRTRDNRDLLAGERCHGCACDLDRCSSYWDAPGAAWVGAGGRRLFEWRRR